MRISAPSAGLHSVLCSVLVSLFGCTVLGCSVRPRPLIPSDYTAEVTGADREQVLERLNAESQRIKSYRILADATLSQGDSLSAFRYIVVVDHISRVRLEMLPQNAGYPLNLYVSNGAEATFLVPPEHQAVTGNRSLLRRALGVPLIDQDLRSLVTGRVDSAVLTDNSLRVLSSSTNTDYLLVVQGSRSYRVDPASLLCREVELRTKSGRSTLLRVNYGAIQEQLGVSLPYSVTLAFPEEESILTLNIQRADINPALSQRLFEVKIPEDYSVSDY